MHITLEADYAVRIVNCLAKNNVRMDAKTLSAQTGVTLRFSLKILRKLVAQGIVRSFKGTQGGYELARPADQITLGEVIECVEGVITFSRCVDNEEFVCTCGDSADCRFNKAYKELSQMVREKLYSITFAQ
ncbi:RrF2 family transcriptional regulator [Youxingia wuxianensis]|uniref:Rrf2 family transcriptional regulator n=1 Tax=Youxingia wuxianensis TaxID=2763678 RepID=A0A926EQH0_9FIRM|nr:Rrf2 family transcriptional regulator [Youxingia wuxianensis]MBC8584499.1 Rrf2 family transcriptional regulator [Youxingia wuxianensis]